MRKRILTWGLCLILVCSLIGCGSPKNITNSLVLWINCNEKELNGYKELIDKWSSNNGINVKINADNIDADMYIGAQNNGAKSDLVWGASTEDLEKFIKSNTIEELRAGFDNEQDYVSQDLLQNTSMNGKRYAIPIYQESVALFYNKDLVSTVPTDMNELIKEAKEKGLTFNINNGFFSYGFISSCGGYVFKNQDGNFKNDDIGLNNEGAIKGYTILQEIGNKNKLVSGDTSDEMAEVGFGNGDKAYYIGESKKIPTFEKLKVNFGVAKIPQIDGQDFKSFKTVKMAFVNPKSKHKDKSYGLMKYLIQNAGNIMIKDGYRVPVLKSDIQKEVFQKDEYLQGFYKQVQVAEVTPNISSFKCYWQAMDRNLDLLTSGKQTPKECGKSVEKDIKQLMKN